MTTATVNAPEGAAKQREGFRELPLAQLAPNPNQPRKNFNQEALMELADSIREHGLIQPITVRPMGSDFQIIAGERRWRAAQLAGLTKVPCRVMQASDELTMILAITENVNRQDMDLIEEANAFNELVKLGKTNAQIAELFGKSEDMIGWTLALLNLTEPLQWMVAKGQISHNNGEHISHLTPENQQAVMARIVAGEFHGADQINRYADAVKLKQDQGGLDLGPVEDPITATRRAARRTELEIAWERIEKLTPGLQPYMEAEPQDLAFALADADLFDRKVSVLLSAVKRVRANIRDAAAIQKAAAGS